MFGRVRMLLEMIRFSHTVFALPFALSSAVLAWRYKGAFSFLELTGILVCMVFARSAAMAFNRLVDQRYDTANPRTEKRHLPAGLLSRRAVWIFLIVCSMGFVLATCLFLWSEPSNPWPVILSLPVLIFICAYSFAKRFTLLVHFWLGISLFLAPVAAWIAINGMNGLATPLVLGLAVLFWVAGFDILYACQDVDFDRKSGLRSVPAKLGIPRALRLAMICHILMLGALLALFWVPGSSLGYVYLAGVVLVAMLLVYEHWLVRPDDLNRVNRAFFHVNGVISVGLFVVILLQLAVDSWAK